MNAFKSAIIYMYLYYWRSMDVYRRCSLKYRNILSYICVQINFVSHAGSLILRKGVVLKFIMHAQVILD